MAFLAYSPALAADDARRPNVLLIVADDLGYADLGCHGCKDIPTPHIDSLAMHGVRCTSGYVSGPYCSPTRAGLLTGRYQQRFGHEFNPGPSTRQNEHMGLALSEVTLADRLKAAGYATGLVGKWHLGHADRFHPLRRGFESYFGFLGGAHPYRNNDRPANADDLNPILRGFDRVGEPEYLTDALAREAVAFVDRHQERPFFLMLAFNAVHAPLQATDKYLSRFPSIAEPRRRTYAAMVSAMDDALGSVLAKLRETNLEQNTLIFFISDNGGPPVNASSNLPLRGYKVQTFEGGIRVPTIVQWKGKLPEGAEFDRPVIQLDILPTALAAAGVKLGEQERLDGVDLMPFLSGKAKGDPHARLYWRFGQQRALRQGDWKLVQGPGGGTQLFNLADDVGEQNDLSAKHPDKLAQLEAAWKEWNSQLAPPAWNAPGQARQATAARRAQ